MEFRNFGHGGSPVLLDTYLSISATFFLLLGDLSEVTH